MAKFDFRQFIGTAAQVATGMQQGRIAGEQALRQRQEQDFNQGLGIFNQYAQAQQAQAQQANQQYDQDFNLGLQFLRDPNTAPEDRTQIRGGLQQMQRPQLPNQADALSQFVQSSPYGRQRFGNLIPQGTAPAPQAPRIQFPIPNFDPDRSVIEGEYQRQMRELHDAGDTEGERNLYQALQNFKQGRSTADQAREALINVPGPGRQIQALTGLRSTIQELNQWVETRRFNPKGQAEANRLLGILRPLSVSSDAAVQLRKPEIQQAVSQAAALMNQENTAGSPYELTQESERSLLEERANSYRARAEDAKQRREFAIVNAILRRPEREYFAAFKSGNPQAFIAALENYNNAYVSSNAEALGLTKPIQIEEARQRDGESKEDWQARVLDMISPQITDPKAKLELVKFQTGILERMLKNLQGVQDPKQREAIWEALIARMESTGLLIPGFDSEQASKIGLTPKQQADLQFRERKFQFDQQQAIQRDRHWKAEFAMRQREFQRSLRGQKLSEFRTLVSTLQSTMDRRARIYERELSFMGRSNDAKANMPVLDQEITDLKKQIDDFAEENDLQPIGEGYTPDYNDAGASYPAGMPPPEPANLGNPGGGAAVPSQVVPDSSAGGAQVGVARRAAPRSYDEVFQMARNGTLGDPPSVGRNPALARVRAGYSKLIRNPRYKADPKTKMKLEAWLHVLVEQGILK